MERARTCVGCRRKAPAGKLFRVVADSSGGVVEGAGKPGRGAWLCAGSMPCLRQAIQRKAFARALRTTLRPGSTEELMAAFEGRQARMCEDGDPQ